MKKNKKRKKVKRIVSKKGKIFLFTVASIVILLIIGLVFFLVNKNKPKEEEKKIEPEEEIVIEDKLNIVDLNSNTRSIAVMINNHATARKYHSGLQDAYIMYEMIVEGGITRMLAIYKDADTARIGSVRSSRHYYLDYALENDAIYVHYGWSPQAQRDISSLGVNNLNAVGFWRDKSLGISSEHTAYTSMENINEQIAKKNYRNTTDKKLLLNYSKDEIDLSKYEGAIVANNINIVYSNYNKSQYEYDAENKVYNRSVNGKPHKDYVTGKQYTFKNIITYQVVNRDIPGGGKGRQTLDNIGSGEGYYISNGYAVPITWEKTSRAEQTIYRFKNGEELKVNDGNTFIQIQPKNKQLEIS